MKFVLFLYYQGTPRARTGGGEKAGDAASSGVDLEESGSGDPAHLAVERGSVVDENANPCENGGSPAPLDTNTPSQSSFVKR